MLSQPHAKKEGKNKKFTPPIFFLTYCGNLCDICYTLLYIIKRKRGNSMYLYYFIGFFSRIHIAAAQLPSGFTATLYFILIFPKFSLLLLYYINFYRLNITCCNTKMIDSSTARINVWSPACYTKPPKTPF